MSLATRNTDCPIMAPMTIAMAAQGPSARTSAGGSPVSDVSASIECYSLLGLHRSRPWGFYSIQARNRPVVALGLPTTRERCPGRTGPWAFQRDAHDEALFGLNAAIRWV